MRTPLAIASLCALAACSGAPESAVRAPAAPLAASASTRVAQATVCTRGVISASRSFVLCPEGAAVEDIAAALARPADLSLDAATVARRFGVAKQIVSGMEAATYARIVPNGGKTADPPAADDAAQPSATIEIDGRSFASQALEKDGAVSTIYIEN